ncbi:MFS transporter [Aneurinibacillus aneurinilyticus]|jgi:MFS family permease|uniref:MFS transporter n=1 Tax=Aneurinibacillus aneurinilyticus TaxID=1391 RepID=UPI0023F68A70|nr:MFS transporter [Aneurinibacillus aneurinilyticus]MCI1694518.1 MFS transporter [Aneurinibacillus aneurinilyticus]
MARSVSANYRFFILILVVIIAGLSQGLLLPLLAIILEKAGVSSGANGLNAAALYIGTFLTMLVIEKPVQKLGYKRVITIGVVLVTVATVLFPLWQNLAFWFVLRMLVGMGDSALHYASQLWITSSSPAGKRGRHIAIYGMSYAIGFSVGPLGIKLLPYGMWVPFVTVSILFALAFFLLLRLPHEYPVQEEKSPSAKRRYVGAAQIAWFALIPSFLYGYMEASINSNFPVYGLRMGISEGWVSFLLPAIGIGSLILQLPLGMWSDRIGRKPVLMLSGFLGALAFLVVPLFGAHVWGVFVAFIIAGGLVGSFYSLGLAYIADLVPKASLPAANIIASINFSVGSIVGPNLGGLGIQYVAPGSMFYFLGGMFLLFTICGFFFQRAKQQEESSLIHFTN